MYLRGQPWVCFYTYTICVNNLPELVEQHQVKQYADDTAMSDSVSELKEVLENDLDSVARWVDCFWWEGHGSLV